MRVSRWLVAANAICSTGWFTDVSLGLVPSQKELESNPTTYKS